MYLKRPLTYLCLFLIAFGGFFGNVHIENKHQNNSTIISLSYESNITYAEEPKKPDDASVKAMENYNKMIDGLNIALGVLSAMISPIILFAGWLMSPDWTSGDLFGLREPMYKLWVVVSNIVYFVYAILLILIALGTMFNQDKFSYKVMLPKLALGIILVPFTWWFVQWTISIASVVTATVMTIPMETIGENDSKWFTDPSIPKVITIDNTGTGSNTYAIDCAITPGACQSPKDFLKKSGGMYGPLVVYGYSIFKFQKITRLESAIDVAAAALKIVHTSIVSVIMFAVFGLLVLALTSMLLIRAVKLWMYAIFSPLFTFRFVAGSNLMAGGGDDSDSFSIKEFMGLAFVPAIVGLTLSFGLIMINAVQGPAKTATSAPTGKECDLSKEGCKIEGIMGNDANSIVRTIENFGKKDPYTKTVFKYADIEFYFLGKASNQSNPKSTSSGAIDAVGGMFGTLIIDVIALVFIWMAFMAAKGVSKAVKFAVDPFEKIGQQVGSMAKSLPKYTPLPIPGGSIAGLGKVSAMPEQFLSQRASEKTKGIEESMGKLFGVNLKYKESDSQDLKNSNGDLHKVETKIAELRGRGIDLKDAEGQRSVNDMYDAIKAIPTALRKGIPDKDVDDAKSAAERIKLIERFQTGGINTSKTDETIIKEWKEGKTVGKTGTTGTNNPIGVRLPGTEKINISIGGSDFTIENIAGKKDVTFGTDDSLKLKDKKAGMTAENFKKSLMSTGTMSDEAAENLVQKIKTDHKDFFDTPPAKP